MQEEMGMRGALTLRLTDRGGLLLAERRYQNRIVLSGRQLVAQLFGGAPDGRALGRITHIAVGTGGDRAADRQEKLVAERGPRRPVDPPAYSELTEGTGESALLRVKVSLVATFDYGEANGSQPLQEAGLFNAPSEGVMYNRVTFEPVTKTDAFKLTLIWEVIF